MATYKVIQDIEAEDKILGPLTLRQFIYAGIAATLLYLTYFVASKGATFMIGAFLPAALVAAFFAVPWGRDQPTEIWALAKIRFMLKPRRRIWDQTAIKELVTITAPKKEAQSYLTKNLTQNEVKSRLLALADTLDSRGWAVKNASITIGQPSLFSSDPSSDRLVSASSLPQQPMQMVDIRAGDDILDEQNNPIAQHVNSMIEASAKAHRQKIMDNLNQPTPTQSQPANNYWFLNQPSQAASVPDNMVTFNTQVVTPGMQEEDLAPGAGAPAQPSQADENLVKELDARRGQQSTNMAGHMHTLQPIASQHPHETPPPTLKPVVASPANDPMPSYQAPAFSTGMQVAPVVTTFAAPQVTGPSQAAILQLASNDDLNVATLAREAKNSGPQDDNEVVIRLH